MAGKVSQDDFEKQTSKLYAQIGRIAVISEHLNHAMELGCSLLLREQGNENRFVDTALAGMNLENSRRLWVAMFKQAFASDPDGQQMLNHISTRLDNVIRRRNETIHCLWFIGWGNEHTESYETASGMKLTKDIRDSKQGGVRVTNRDTRDFEEIIEELEILTKLVLRLAGATMLDAPLARNFHFEDGKLMPGSRP